MRKSLAKMYSSVDKIWNQDKLDSFRRINFIADSGNKYMYYSAILICFVENKTSVSIDLQRTSSNTGEIKLISINVSQQLIIRFYTNTNGKTIKKNPHH